MNITNNLNEPELVITKQDLLNDLCNRDRETWIKIVVMRVTSEHEKMIERIENDLPLKNFDLEYDRIFIEKIELSHYPF